MALSSRELNDAIDVLIKAYPSMVPKSVTPFKDLLVFSTLVRIPATGELAEHPFGLISVRMSDKKVSGFNLLHDYNAGYSKVAERDKIDLPYSHFL